MLSEADLGRRSPFRRLVDWVAASRSHRVICLMAGLWLINLFDLILTSLAHAQGMLEEVNPIARHLLPLGPQALAVFKVVLVGGSSAVLIRYRTLLCAEVTAGVMMLVYAGVAVRWRLCYELYELTTAGSISNCELEKFDSWLSTVPII